MDERKRLAAFLAQRQGLCGAPLKGGPAAVLERAGWARTVGGANPYVTVFSRAGLGRAEVDRALADRMVEELPSARSCTYLLPASDVWIGLRATEGGSSVDARRGAKIGVTEAETEALCQAVLAALKGGPLSPQELRSALGGQVRSLGEEGKRQGLSTNLPIALGRLQETGSVSRVQAEGRLDNERYRYRLWEPSPLEGAPDRETALRELAARYWSWIGLASLAHFRSFSGLGAKAAAAVTDGLGLVEAAPGLLATPDVAAAYEGFRVPDSPDIRLVASLDSVFLLRREVQTALGGDGVSHHAKLSGKAFASGGLADLEFNAILDRGTVVGFWEYDPYEERIVYQAWDGDGEAVRKAVASTEEFVRGGLGDCRSFSHDSPKSRIPRLNALRG